MVPIHNSYRHFRRVIVTQHLKSFCIEHRVALTGAMHNFDGCCRFAPKPNPSPFSDRVLDPEAYPIPKQCVPCLQRDWLRGPARPCCQQGLLAAPLCPPACTLGRAVSGPVLLQTTFRVRTGGRVSTTRPGPITLHPLHEACMHAPWCQTGSESHALIQLYLLAVAHAQACRMATASPTPPRARS